MKQFLQSKKKYILSGLLSCLAAGAGAQWMPVGPIVNNRPNTEGQTLPSGDYNCMVLDTSGRPYVAYWDPNQSSKVSVRKFDDTGWAQVGTPGFSAAGSMYVNIARSREDTIFVAYRDQAFNGPNSSGRITVKKLNGNNWETVGNAQFSESITAFCRIQIDPAGTPYVLFGDFAGAGIMALNGKLSVMKYDGTSWVYVGPQGFTPGATDGCELRINSAGVPFVVYSDKANSNMIAVRRYDAASNTWVSVGTNGFSTADTRDPQIIFDSNDKPYVSYRDIANGSRVSVMTYDSTAADWVYVGGAGFSNPVMVTNYDLQYRYCVLEMDDKNRPYVAFTDAYEDGKISVMRYEPSAGWTQVGNGVFGHSGKCLYMTRHKNDLYVSYIQNTVFQGPWPGYAWKFDMCDQPSVQAVITTANTLCEGDSAILSISSGALGDAQEWFWYNGTCGGVSIAEGDTLRIAPGTSARYFVRGEGGCVASPVCDSIDITVHAAPLPAEIDASGQRLRTTHSYHRYQWFKNGVLQESETDRLYEVTENARYSVVVSTENGCTDSASYNVTNLGILDGGKLAEAISIYPNPAQDILRVDAPVPLAVRISSMEGKTMLQTESGTDIHIGRLAAGMYLMHISDADGTHIRTEKIVKNR